MTGPRVPDGPAPAPVAQRVRIRYAKRGRLRFASTRDFQRALERALRVTQLPLAFSGGFHPRPRVSYANAAATGTASEAEYAEIALTRRVEPQHVRAALGAALPEGFEVLDCAEADEGSLADRLQASDWQVLVRGLPSAVVREAAARFLAAPRAEVTRMVKSGIRTFDARGPVVSMRVLDVPADERGESAGDAECAILRVVVRHTTPAVRPDDILNALRDVAGLEPPAPPLVTRLAQGPLHDATATVADPLAADRNAAGA